MASETYEVPSLDFGFYYPEALQALLAHNRINNPEITDESEYEPFIQALRSFALVCHNNNVIADLIANESVLETAKLVESVRAHLAKIDYIMAPARPASVEVVCELSRVFTAAKNIVPVEALFATERDPTTDVTVFYETNGSKSVTATNAFTNVLANNGGTFTDYTTEANSVSSPADDFSPWDGNMENGDAIYFGHDSVMWNQINTFATTEIASGSGIGLWEYHSGDVEKAAPDTVTDLGSHLHFDVNGYVGTKNRHGTELTVRYIPNGLTEQVTVVWVGDKNVIETAGLLGQSTVSDDVTKYTIGSEWEPLPGLASKSGVGDIVFGKDDEEIKWTLPQSIADNWQLGKVDGITGYWVRFRWIVPPAAGPVMKYATVDNGQQFVIVPCTQGRSQYDTLGSSTAAKSQVFEGTKSFFIDDGNETVSVDAVTWTRVENFINSQPTDEHYVVALVGDDDSATFKFGDGKRGKIPALGVNNIDATYRYGGDDDGNVGANTVVSDKSSLSFVSSIFNPRQAIGWSPAEGATTESLELAKQTGPASIRATDVAISYTDLPRLTKRFVDSNGSSLYGRAFAIEESFGPKTVELVVVAKGGGNATQIQLDELALFYNGDKAATPPVEAHLVSNQKVTATNYVQRLIPIKAKVYGSGFTELQIENALKAVIDPEAKKKDGVTYEWEFGAEVSLSRLKHEIHAVSPKITKVVITEPAQDVGMTFRELPKVNAITIEIPKEKA